MLARYFIQLFAFATTLAYAAVTPELAPRSVDSDLVIPPGYVHVVWQRSDPNPPNVGWVWGVSSNIDEFCWSWSYAW